MSTNHAIRLKSHAKGAVALSNFELVELPIPEPAAGEALVQNLWMSVDPYMRARMEVIPGEEDGPFGPWPTGTILDGRALGRVIRSNDPTLEPGQLVFHTKGWREYVVMAAADLRIIPDLATLPEQIHLSLLGSTGATAYWSLRQATNLAPGHTVYVTGAGGAVGSLVCQIAKLHGCRVVASASNTDKLRWLQDAGKIDVALSYKDDDLRDAMVRACADGIDIYYDNVGGPQLDIGLTLMREDGEVILCGNISDYNNLTGACAPTSFNAIRDKCLTVRGFMIYKYADRLAEFQAVMLPWIRSGAVQGRETIFEGIVRAPEAFIAMMQGITIGKTLVKLV